MRPISPFDVYALTGPDKAVEIITSDIVVTIETKAKLWSPIFAGPFLPVLPTFLYKYWADRNDPQTELIKIWITIKDCPGRTHWKARDIKVVLPDNRVFYPIECVKISPREKTGLQRFFSQNQEMRKIKYCTIEAPEDYIPGDEINIAYDLLIREVDSFNLQLDGLIIGDKPILFPDINYIKSSGYVLFGMDGM